ncbi:phage tail tape measure protein [Paenibacillus alvei]|uniref:phage tail tape measure protein n=1 Tax=Paenibacillus alvei TaxID=44250 RepID=UPI0018CFD3C7|nr:phage tail tape measure protein [Paenibacillus alvei]MCY9579552.1 phage tail tape measure protein [Paenibacillus alvei]MCY9586512.1 phage tail tape measure protein [Paenibacillus alvei]
MSEIEVANLVTKLSMEDTGVETSMAALGRQMKAVQSEFQAASSKLGEHANSQEGLKLKADALSRQMDIQAQKILQLKRKHEEAVAAKGRDARETQNLERQLNRAVTEYNRMHHELQSTNSEIEKQAAAWDKISNKLEASARKLESVGTAMTKVGASLSMLITAPLAAAGGAALKASVDYETAFTGVVKTVDASKEKLAEFKQEIRDMSKEIPAAATSIAKVAESAGQLGIKNEALMGFTRTMTDMGVATNMASDQAAVALARLANITQMPQQNFDRLGSTVVALGNNLATTESEIVEMGLRLAGSGKQIGMTEAQILSFAGALSSVGIEAEMGGSAFSRVMIDMAMAAQVGGKSLDNFALVAGMTATQFKETFQRDASQALIAFVEGLGRMSEAGENTFLMLDKLGLSEIRVRDTLLRASGAGDLFRNSMEVGTKAWAENIALTKEAETRYETTASKIQILRNKINDSAITMGDALVPALLAVFESLQPPIDKLAETAQWFANLDTGTQKQILGWAAFAAALGPALLVLGQLVFAISNLIPVIKALGASMIWLMTNPIGLIITGIGAAIGVFFAIKNSMNEAEEAARQLAKAQEDLQAVQQNGITHEEVAAAEEKIQALNKLIETYQKLIDTAAESNTAKMGNNRGALDFAAKELGIKLSEVEEEAKKFGVTLEYVDDRGKLTAKSMDKLKDALNIYSKAVKDANRETTAELHQKAEGIARRKQELTSVENLLKTYKSAKKGTQEWTGAQSELARMFPQLNTATGLNAKAVEGLLLLKRQEIAAEWQSIQTKAREAYQEKQTAIAKQEAAIAIAESITKIAGSSGLAEKAIKAMNDQLTRLRGEAASLKELTNIKPEDIKLPPIVIPPVPKVPTGDDSTKKKEKKEKKEAYENKALEAAYKQLEHKKRMDQMTLESELKTLEAIKAKHVKTAEERMEIEERIYEVKKALGDASLEKALKDFERSKQLGKLNENDEITRLQRIKKLYGDSAEERERIEDMIFEATQRKIEAEKKIRSDATEYAKQQLQAAYEDRIARENLSVEEQKKLQDRLLNDQIYINRNYLEKVKADSRYTAAEKRDIERQITEEIRKATNERLLHERKYQEEVRKEAQESQKQRIEDVNKLSQGIQAALREKYQAEKKAEEDRIRESISANEAWKKNQLELVKSLYDSRVKEAEKSAAAEIAAIESVLNAQIQAIQDDLAALEQAEKQKTRAELDAEDQKKIDRLQGKLDYEHDEFNKIQLQKEINKIIADRDKRHQQEQLADKKDALKEQEKSLRDKLKEETDFIKQQLAEKKEMMQLDRDSELERINQIAEAQKASLDQMLVSTQEHYNQLLSAKNLQAEAEKMIVQNQQTEIIELLKGFGDSYNIMGQTLGEKMYQGFADKVNKIQTLIDNINRQIDSARSAAISAMHSVTSGSSSGSSSSSNKSNEPIKGTVVQVVQNFNTPVTSPSDVSRANRKLAQML